jgi:hypothetical protein
MEKTMRKLMLAGAALTAAVATSATAALADSPFPTTKYTGVFVAAQTVTAGGAVTNFVAPGSAVVFRAYAVDPKTKKILTAKTVKAFYVKIPNAPNVQLKFDVKAQGANAQLAWTGSWTPSASYPEGVVPFKVLIKTVTKKTGSFEQMPVASAQLTVTRTPQAPLGAPGVDKTIAASSPAGKFDATLYVDAVNGTRPTGAAPRPIGCTQTNVFKRGEQLVVRSWGVDMAGGAILSTDNVKEAHFAMPGQPDVVLNWSAHGTPDNRVFFWANAWNIPTDYPLGDITLKITYTLESGKQATQQYAVTIVP